MLSVVKGVCPCTDGHTLRRICCNYQLPNDPVKAGRRWGQRHPQGANLGSNGILNFLSKLKQWLPPAHPKSLASQCMSGQPIVRCCPRPMMPATQSLYGSCRGDMLFKLSLAAYPRVELCGCRIRHSPSSSGIYPWQLWYPLWPRQPPLRHDDF